MRKYFVLLFAIVLFTACEKDDVVIVPKADKTILTYFVGDNNLENSLRDNIVDMYRGLEQVGDSCTLLVYFDGSGDSIYWSKPCILRYMSDGRGRVNNTSGLKKGVDILAVADVLKQYPSQLSTDKVVMAKVLQDMITLSPSKSYGLIAGSHGSGWLKSIFGTNSRSFGQDGEGTDNTMAIADMADAVKSVGVKFDFFLFDACMMGCAEVYYDFRDIAKYMIASVINVPGPGFPYEQILPYLYGEGSADYQKVCEGFIDYYIKRSYYGTISLVDCSQMQALADVVRQQIVSHKDLIETYSPLALQFYGERTSFSFRYYSADMKQFIEDLNGGEVPITFAEQLSKTVLYTDFVRESSYNISANHYCGMGMYIPLVSKNYWNEYFKTISWYTAAGWNETIWAN